MAITKIIWICIVLFIQQTLGNVSEKVAQAIDLELDNNRDVVLNFYPWPQAGDNRLLPPDNSFNHDPSKTNPTECKVDSERYGDVVIIYVRNANGDILEVIEEYSNQDFQVINPTDEKDHVCLIRDIDQDTKDDDTCYERVPLTPITDEQKEDALDKCADRMVYSLQKVDCSNTYKARAKRETCVTIRKPVWYFLRYEPYCTSYGWWQCKSWGTRCAESEIRDSVEITCA